MVIDDAVLRRFLLDRGLVTAAECERARELACAKGLSLQEVLIEESYVSRGQIEEAIESAQKRPRRCETCESDVLVRRSDKRCPKCGTAFEGAGADEEELIEELEEAMPSEVRTAREAVSRRIGKYVLLDELGRGGNGVVHKAWDSMLADYVALKFLREPESTGQISEEERRIQHHEQVLELMQEARALRLRHKNILPILDFGRHARQVYICMEFVEGRTLAQLMSEAHARGRVSCIYEDPIYYLGLMRDVCDAIHYAHTFRRPLVHCDLKPGNILVSKAGTPYVMDFGLARAIDMPPEHDVVVRGTPAYMAPEQLSGRARDIGVWTDVYGLGAILYELLTGRAVYGDTSKVVRRSTSDVPDRPTDVIRGTPEVGRREVANLLTKMTRLEEICMRCVAPAPRDRYASAQDVAEELDIVIAALQAGKTEGLVPPEIKEQRERSKTRKRIRQTTEAVPEGEEGEAYKRTTRVEPQGKVEMPERFRARLAQRVNEMRPHMPQLALARGSVSQADLVHATAHKVVVFSGEEARTLDWEQLAPSQIVALAELLEMKDTEDRLALGIFCYHLGLNNDAKRLCESLRGTSAEKTAAQILKWIGAK